MSTPLLPFSGATPQSRHASYLGARDAQGRAPRQSERYLALLQEHPDGLTDWEAAARLGVERTTINARRMELVKMGKVYSDGFRKNETSGIRNTVWKARAS